MKPILNPERWSRADRLALADQISNTLRERLGERCLAIGIYGSTGRAEDGPFSDLEMHCIISDPPDFREYLEWTEGPYKSSVDVLALEVAHQKVDEVDVDWAIGAGEFLQVLPTYDPQNLFASLAERTLGISDKQVKVALAEIIVGHLYEYIGKLRTALEAQNENAAPWLAFEVVQCGCWMIGLLNRTPFGSTTRLIETALTLEQRPDGFDLLAGRVQSGQLSHTAALSQEIEAFWKGCLQLSQEMDLPLRIGFEGELQRLDQRWQNGIY